MRKNIGKFNTGDWNTGDWNTGNYNTGYFNAGCCNTGNYNTGYFNAGYCNTGFWNTGNRNSGDYNTGHYNTGCFNSGNYNTGCFNTKEQKIRMFNKMSKLTLQDWCSSKAYRILKQMPTSHLKWINENDMTEEEKKNNADYTTTGGCLRLMELSNNDRQNWWDNLCEEDKKTIKSLPNFDSKIFKKITGIDVEANVEG